MGYSGGANAIADSIIASVGDNDDGPALSQNLGEGAGSMASLVQKALVNIVAPLLQRLGDLEETSALHKRELKVAHEKADSAAQRIGLHDRSISAIESDLIRTKSDLKRAHELICEASEHHSSLDNDHEITRAIANRLDSGHKSMGSLLADQQRLHEDLEGRCRQVQQGLSETNTAHISINDRLQELRTRLDGLNDRHLDLVKSTQELKQADEANKGAFKRITTTAERQRRDTERGFAQVDDRSKNLELAIIELQGADEKALKVIRATRQDVERNRSTIEQLMGEGGKLGSASSGPKPSDVQGRVNRVEEMVGKLATALSTDSSGTQQSLQQLREAVAHNAAGMTKNASDYEHLDKMVKSQDHRLYKVEQRCGLIEGRSEKLKDQLERQESELKNQLGNAQASLQAKLDTQAHELAKTNERISQGGSKVDILQSGLDNIKTELASTNGAVGKLGHGLDLAHEYVQGMSKGLTDTHKRVHGDGAPSPTNRPFSARGTSRLRTGTSVSDGVGASTLPLIRH